MLERFRRTRHDGEAESREGGAATRRATHGEERAGDGRTRTRDEGAGDGIGREERIARRDERGDARDRDAPRDDRAIARGDEARARQRDEYGGFNWGAAFFGWLVAIGMAVILIAILSAAGAAIGLTELSESEAEQSADTISIVGGALLILILFLAYYAGGYVAGRMSRFDGGRQGLGVWILGLLVTVALAVAGAIFGSEYNVLEQLDLPRIPIEEGDLTTGGLIALAAIVLATLIGALLGGKSGQRYHRKVDRAGHRV